MTVDVKAYQPRCTVSIGKYDLSPYLGDGARVITHKDLYAPVGKWEVSLPDKPYRATEEDAAASGGEGGTPPASGNHSAAGDAGSTTVEEGDIVDSFYGLIKPFDYCEIRMARKAHEYTEEELPIIMRGFVRSITRDESIDGSGRPSRSVVIRGDDYGCFGEIATLNPLAAATLGQDILPAIDPIMQLTQNPRDIVSTWTSTVVQEKFLDGLINERIKALEGETRDERITEIKLDSTVTKGAVPFATLQSQQGTAWAVMTQFADTPWNELFIEDREDGPYLVYRPTPWRDYKSGALIPNMDEEIDPETIDVIATPASEVEGEGEGEEGGTDEQVFDLVRNASYTRTDQQVYNIFWVQMDQQLMDFNAALAQAIESGGMKPWVNQTKWKNSKASIYGPRTLVLQTKLQPSDGVVVKSGTAEIDEVDQVRMDANTWQDKRREWLALANRDNAMFDQGSLTLRGNEKVKIGAYIDAERGAFWATHYIVQVTHAWTFPGGYSTTINFIRGTNWHNRQGEEGGESSGSPYLKEGRKGLYAKSSFGGIAGMIGMAIGLASSFFGDDDDTSGMNDGETSYPQDPTDPTDPRNPNYGVAPPPEEDDDDDGGTGPPPDPGSVGTIVSVNGERMLYGGAIGNSKIYLKTGDYMNWDDANAGGTLISESMVSSVASLLGSAGAMETAQLNGLPTSWCWTSSASGENIITVRFDTVSPYFGKNGSVKTALLKPIYVTTVEA